MSTLTSTIFDNKGNKITIACRQDLQKLPEKSIRLLFDNDNYIEVIYLYVLYRLDMYLDWGGKYTEEERTQYFNQCFAIIPKLIKHQEYFLTENKISLDDTFKSVPEEIWDDHKICLINTRCYFSGILSSTPYLDEARFPKEKRLSIKHNCGNLLNILEELLRLV